MVRTLSAFGGSDALRVGDAMTSGSGAGRDQRLKDADFTRKTAG